MDAEEPVKEFKKRAASAPRKISNISKSDSRVAVVGSVIDVDEKNFVFTLDDSAKKINVILLDENLIHKAKVGRILRVIGVVIAGESGVELKGEIVQDFSGLSVEYYNKYLDLLAKP